MFYDILKCVNEIENILIMFIFHVLLTCTLLSDLLNGVTVNSQRINKHQVGSALIRWSWKKAKNQQVVGGDVYLEGIFTWLQRVVLHLFKFILFLF